MIGPGVSSRFSSIRLEDGVCQPLSRTRGVTNPRKDVDSHAYFYDVQRTFSF